MSLNINDFYKKTKDGLIREFGDDDIVGFVYTQECVRSRAWCNITKEARGILFNRKTGKIIALPFRKFFNLHECSETEPKNLPKEPYCIWEKVDGSLGIVFWNPIRECWDISTKGSLHSDQANFARETLLPRHARALEDHISHSTTVLTEIIYPENRIVVDYGEMKELRLLAMRNIHTGDYENSDRIRNILTDRLGMASSNSTGILSRTHHPEQFADLFMKENMEGWVLEFESGFRVKVKNSWYLTIHRALDSKSLKRIIALVEGREWRSFWEALPKDLQKEFDDLYSQIRTAIWDVENRAQDAWKACSDAKMVIQGRNGRLGRRDFAVWVQINVESELQPIMYSILDGHDWRHHVFSIIKRKFK